MRLSPLWSLPLLLACTPPVGDSADTAADAADTGDTGADTGDTSADTGDTSGDTGDTADTAVACTWADLVLTASSRGTDGVSRTTFTAGEAVVAVGTLHNPCTSEVSFVTAQDYVFTGFLATDSTNYGHSTPVNGHAVETTWTVPAGEALEGTSTFEALAADTYALTVVTAFPTEAHTTFVIEAAR